MAFDENQTPENLRNFEIDEIWEKTPLTRAVYLSPSERAAGFVRKSIPQPTYGPLDKNANKIVEMLLEHDGLDIAGLRRVTGLDASTCRQKIRKLLKCGYDVEVTVEPLSGDPVFRALNGKLMTKQ